MVRFYFLYNNKTPAARGVARRLSLKTARSFAVGAFYLAPVCLGSCHFAVFVGCKVGQAAGKRLLYGGGQ